MNALEVCKQFYGDGKSGVAPKYLQEDQWEAPDLTMLSDMDLVMLQHETAKSDHWSDKKFREAVLIEMGRRKKQPTVS